MPEQLGMARLGRWAAVSVASPAWAALVLSAAVLLLTVPAYTRALTARLGVEREAGLTRAEAARAAESVRRYVVDPSAPPLPVEVGGRPGFDAKASSHLRDVRSVLSAARVTALAAVVALGLWALIVRRWGRREVARGLRGGAVALVLVTGAAALAALTDFGRFFVAFHGLFFASGTWTFPEGSLLITLFPEPFWVWSAVAWGALAALGAAGLLLAAHAVGRTAGRFPSHNRGACV